MQLNSVDGDFLVVQWLGAHVAVQGTGDPTPYRAAKPDTSQPLSSRVPQEPACATTREHPLQQQQKGSSFCKEDPCHSEDPAA